MIQNKTIKKAGLLGISSLVLALCSQASMARVADWAVPIQTATDLRALTQMKEKCEAGNVALKIKTNPVPHNTFFQKYVYNNCLMSNGYLVNGFVVYSPTNGVDKGQSIYDMDVIFSKQNVRYKGQGIVVTPDHVVVDNQLQQFWPVGPGQKIDKRLRSLNEMADTPSQYYGKLSHSTITSADIYYKNKSDDNYNINGFVKMIHNDISYMVDINNVNFNANNLATSYNGDLDYTRSILSSSNNFNEDFDLTEFPNTKQGHVLLSRDQYVEGENSYLLKGDALSEFLYFDFKDYGNVKQGTVSANNKKVKNNSSISYSQNMSNNKKVNKISSKFADNTNVGCQSYDKSSNDLRNYVAKQHNYIAGNLSDCKDYSSYPVDYHVKSRPYYEYYNFARPPAFYPHSIQQKQVFEFSRQYHQSYNNMYFQNGDTTMTDGYGYWHDEDSK